MSGRSTTSPIPVFSCLSQPACGHGSTDVMPHALYPVYRLKRHRLLVSCATLAITVALTPQRAWAQAYQGTPTTATGTVSYARATPGSETITVGSSTATVNWAPTEAGTGNINF